MSMVDLAGSGGTNGSTDLAERPAPGTEVAAVIQRVGVVGSGLMGSGIAEVCARAGLSVTVVEAGQDALAAGQRRIESSLSKAVDRGKLAPEARDAVTGPGTILASNTSSIPIMKLAMVTSRPEEVLGLHFFNPVPVMRLVELVTSLLTSESTAARAADFADQVLHKRIVRSKDRAGFIVNALLIPYLLSAIRMVESGFATVADIDAGMVEGCAHPMGPLSLSDLIGLDTVSAVAESLYDEFKEPLYAPPPLLDRMCEAGLLGRKVGRGFYDYNGR
jgi:3-hydroxybutyryl-CoA dehydrogenase